MLLAALGLFVFELATAAFDELDRRTDWRHAASARVGARDALQFVGPGDDILSIKGAIYPGAIGSFASIDTLRRMADEGQVHAFVDGRGRVLGYFVITALDERASYFLDDGSPRKKGFQLELKRAA